MNILSIYPEFWETFWSFNYTLSFIGKKAALPPLGLVTVAPLLPEEWHKHLLDVNVDKLEECMLNSELLIFENLLIQESLISAMSAVGRNVHTSFHGARIAKDILCTRPN